MELHVETISKRQAILIVSRDKNLDKIFRSNLKKFHCDLFFSPNIPSNLSFFDYCFFINMTEVAKNDQKKIIYIFINRSKDSQRIVSHQKKLPNIKIIDIVGEINQLNIDNILWFSFSTSKETYLRTNNAQSVVLNKVTHAEESSPRHKKFLDRQSIIFAIVFFIVFIHLSFIPPLLVASMSLFNSVSALKNEDFPKIENNLNIVDKSLAISKKLYSFSRPTFLLFSLALIPDNIIDLNERGRNILQKSISIAQNTKEIFKMILKKDKNTQEKGLLSLRIANLRTAIDQIEEDLNSLTQKIPSQKGFFGNIKKQLIEADEMTIRLKKLIPHLETILAKDTEKRYLLLFANNKELRPGGGFIGSFGIIKIHDMTLEDIKIYDVYDADGQLIAHIEPPTAIRKYMNQPHWFLRDSAFSPDFLENYAQAKFFLEKEMGLQNFSGVFLITTSAIENILETFDNLYLPDFNENINSKNFYLKTQIHAEKDFFPGSIQKKSFLSSLTNQIMLNLENISAKKLVTQLKKSLDEKQLVVYFDDSEIENVIDNFYWSGRVINVSCTTNSENCLVDYIFPYDANLGINKANFFISRETDLKINIDTHGKIDHYLTLKFKNESLADIFPGGTYKNYFQLLLPLDVTIKTITKNNTLIEDFDEKDDQFKRIGFLFEVEPQSTAQIKINYTLEKEAKKGKNIYQLIFQKQIGSSNNDFSLEVNLPKNIYLLNQNFSPLVKDNRIVYNTTLSADKIFFLELIKE